ncbi:MAG: Sir2 family NAD-dependent protein deacetylase [Candidatus Xenobiia bacterium LiM19]
MLELSYELSHQLESDETVSHIYVRVKITAPIIEMQKRRALNLGLILDRSGSMEGDKIAFCRHASKFIVSQLSSEDIFSLVVFDDRAEVIYPAQHVTDKEHLKTLIDKISARGTTNLSGGWLASSREVLKNIDREKIHRIILLTDGKANQGVTDCASLLGIAGNLTEKGISTTSIGFGLGFQEDLLKGIADAGRGNFYFIDSPEKAPRTFSEELSGLLILFAQNLILTINPSEHVEFVGIRNDFQTVYRGKEVQVDLGDISAGDERTLIIEFVTPASIPGGEAGISVINLSYQKVYEQLSFNELTVFITVGPDHCEEVTSQEISPVIQKELLLSDSIKARIDAVREADKGNFFSARDILKMALNNLEHSAFAWDEAIREEIDRLDKLISGYEDNEYYETFLRKESLYQSVVLTKRMCNLIRSRHPIMPSKIIDILKNSRKVTVITGSDLAIECEIPGVRGTTYTEGDEEIKVYTKETFEKKPDIVWKYIRNTQSSVVNIGLKQSYRVISEMEDFWIDFHLITENVDGLHRIAGNNKLTELYGNIFRARCSREGRVIDEKTALSKDRTCSCGSPLRPDVLWLGEDFEESVLRNMENTIMESEALIIVGTTFHRSQEMIFKAKENNCLIVEINPSAISFSQLADIYFQKSAEEILPKLWKEVLR